MTKNQTTKNMILAAMFLAIGLMLPSKIKSFAVSITVKRGDANA